MTRLLLATVMVASTLTFGVPPAGAQSSSVGAPTSAAGGTNPAPLNPPTPDLSPGAGPQVPSSGTTGSGSRDLAPGTGKFEAPKNAPCIGTTGFGSSNAQPGHKC